MQLLGSGSDGRIFIGQGWKYAQETFSINAVGVSGSLLESKCF